MDNEIIEKIQHVLDSLKSQIQEVETMIADIDLCKSEVSKKYLAAALKKQCSGIPATAAQLGSEQA